MAFVLYDNTERSRLYPLNTCRATAELRCGIWSVEERWKLFAGADNIYIQTTPLLQQLYQQVIADAHIWVDASWLCDTDAMHEIANLKQGEFIVTENEIIATTMNPWYNTDNSSLSRKTLKKGKAQQLKHPWHLFQYNSDWIRNDMQFLDSTNIPVTRSGNNTFLGEGAEIKNSIINDETGPVYIGRNALVMEGCTVRGPFAMGDGAVLKMGSRIYGAVTLGQYCVGGGEIKNAVLQSFSNKAHDGYLGDSVTGQWCNLGAGTTNSNVKNDAGIVQLWNPLQRKFEPVAQKCGMVMGDYCRTAIQTTINTGTMIDTGCSVFGNTLVRKYLPAFVQGDNQTNQRIPLNQLLRAIGNWKQMKHQTLSVSEEDVIQTIYEGG